MRIVIILLLAFLPALLLAQTTDSIPVSGGVVKGTIKDSTNGFPLQSVTITVFKAADTSLIDFQLTDDEGNFNIQKLPLSMPLVFRATSTGYKTIQKNLLLDSVNRVYDFKSLMLSRGYETLEEVVIQAVLPIRMNGDTLEINPAAFKMDSSAVVEDMLRKVPGVTMWGDGTITVNGKKVNNVFVDGKPFFGGDPAIATQNLPKNAIEKIQVYQEVDPTKDESEITSTDSLLTMNIKLKPDKKYGYFGKGGAGYGTDKRYEADLAVQAFNKKSRLSLAAITNNINKTADLRGIQQQTTFRSFNPRNSYVANFGGRGISKVGFVGGQFQHNFMENPNNRYTNELNASANIRGNDNLVTTETHSQNTASGNVFLTNSNRRNNTQSDNYGSNFNYEKRDRKIDFSVGGNVSFGNSNSASTSVSESEREGYGLVSRSNETSTSTSKNNNYGFNIRYRNIDNEETNLKAFSVNYNFSYGNNESERKTLSTFISTVNPKQNTDFNRLYNSDGTNLSHSVGFNYSALKRLLFGSNQLGGVQINFSHEISLSRNDNNSNVSDFDSTSKQYIINDYLTNTQTVTRFENKPSVNLSKRFNKSLTNRFNRQLQINANLRGQFLTEQNESSVKNRNVTRQVNLFTPSVNLDYNYDRSNKYRINFRLSQQTSASVPTIDQLYPIVDSSNLYTFNYGNQFLKNSRNYSQNFNFSYNTTDRRKKLETGIDVEGGWGLTRNGVSDSTLFDSLGRRYIYLINVDGRSNYNGSVSLNSSLRLKNNNVIQLRYTTGYNSGKTPNYIDGIYSLSRNNSLRNNANLFMAVGEIISFSVGQTATISRSKQTGKTLASLKNMNFVTDANVNVSFPKNLTWGTTMNYVNNKPGNGVSQKVALWNAFATLRFLKSKQAEVKFSAMDLLRQNKNISINTSATSQSTTISNGLQQFYMVTLSYYPRQFGARVRGGMRGGGNGEFERRGEFNRGGGGQRGGGGGQRGGGRRF